MPESLEKLDLLLLTVPKTRRVRSDGIHFLGMRYIDPTLAPYVGEEVLLRYDPRDMAEIRIFHKDRFLCRAICQELAGEMVPLRDIVRARDGQRRELRQTLDERRRKVDSLLDARRFCSLVEPEKHVPTTKPEVRSNGTDMNAVVIELFVHTDEYFRFMEFCDACKKYRYIGLCYGPPA